MDAVQHWSPDQLQTVLGFSVDLAAKLHRCSLHHLIVSAGCWYDCTIVMAQSIAYLNPHSFLLKASRLIILIVILPGLSVTEDSSNSGIGNAVNGQAIIETSAHWIATVAKLQKSTCGMWQSCWRHPCTDAAV